MNYNQEKQVAIAAVVRAATLCMRVRMEMVNPSALEKGDKSPVTVADFGSQALLCQQLKAAFPQDPIVGEEDAVALRRPNHAHQLELVTHYARQFHPAATPTEICDWIDAGNATIAGRYWTLDPIDGTKGFLRNDQYTIALALIEGGEVKVGALACPALPLNLDAPEEVKGVIFVAVRGAGAEMGLLPGDSLAPIHVAGESDKTGFRFVESVEADHGDHALQAAIARAAGISRPSLRMDSQAKYGVVARGDAALYLRLPSPKYPGYREKVWDHAAGSLVVEEAGGRVTDMHGQRLDFASDYLMRRNRGVIVSAGLSHTAVIEALAQYGVEAS